jgi:arginine repressor
MTDPDHDDASRCVVETPDGRAEAMDIIDTDDGMVRVTAVAVADDTWSVVTHSPDAARVLAEELEAAADRAEEESADE